ncbi:MAG: preprotein translocase subunit SecG [Fimbriimonadaceae bacterium]|nr:preprotein translocase subunit SecG [Fimbriimonadaceae bacterium]
MSMTTYNVMAGITGIVAFALIALVFLTGKGDAMGGGGGGVRTTFKGKASFEDQVSRLTLSLAGAFVVLTIILDFISQRIR